MTILFISKFQQDIFSITITFHIPVHAYLCTHMHTHIICEFYINMYVKYLQWSWICKICYKKVLRNLLKTKTLRHCLNIVQSLLSLIWFIVTYHRQCIIERDISIYNVYIPIIFLSKSVYRNFSFGRRFNLHLLFVEYILYWKYGFYLPEIQKN